MKKYKLSMSLVVYLFLLVFNPPIIYKISLVNILAMYSLFYIILTNGKDTRDVIINSKMNKIVILFLISYSYVIVCVSFNMIISGNTFSFDYINTLLNFTREFGALFICTIYVLLKCKREKYTIRDLLLMLLCVGAMQACLTVISFISPTVRSFFIEIMARNIRVDNIAIHITEMANFRVYGFATNLYDAFGYSTSILVTIALAFAFFEKFSYIYLALLLFAMPLLNSRTGIIMTAIGVIVMIIMQLYSIGNYRLRNKAICIFVVLLIFVNFIPNIVLSIAPSSFEWIQKGLMDTLTVLGNGDRNSAGIFSFLMTDKFWFFPSGLSVLFGTGLEPSVLIGVNSDVGYVVNIWKFGIVGSILVYYMYMKLFYYSYVACRSTDTKAIMLFICISFSLYMIKSNAVGLNPSIIIIFMICFKNIYDNSVENMTMKNN